MLTIGAGTLGHGRPVRWADLREMARTAEAVGVDTLFLPDHLLFRKSPPDNLMQVNMPEGKVRGIWEAWTILSALARRRAASTSGRLVAGTGFRNPAILAKMADTLDEVSDGRVVLGHGAGWHEPEYHGFGIPDTTAWGVRGGARDHRAASPRGPRRLRRAVLPGEGLRPRPERPPRRRPADPDRRPATPHARARRAIRRRVRRRLPSGRGRGASRFEALDRACVEAKRDPQTITHGAGTRVALDAARATPAGRARGPASPGVSVFEFGGMRRWPAWGRRTRSCRTYRRSRRRASST